MRNVEKLQQQIIRLKKNFKILVRILSVSAIVLFLIGYFVKNENTKTMLLYIAVAIGAAFLLQVVLFLINPRLFRNKSEI